MAHPAARKIHCLQAGSRFIHSIRQSLDLPFLILAYSNLVHDHFRTFDLYHIHCASSRILLPTRQKTFPSSRKRRNLRQGHASWRSPLCLEWVLRAECPSLGQQNIPIRIDRSGHPHLAVRTDRVVGYILVFSDGYNWPLYDLVGCRFRVELSQYICVWILYCWGDNRRHWGWVDSRWIGGC